MNILLRKLKKEEDNSVWQMFNDIPETENGFGNKLRGFSKEEFDKIVSELVNNSEKQPTDNGRVPQTYFILFIEDIPVGFSKLRHSLTPDLLKRGGHIGCGISPKYRNKGYAKILLIETIKRAKDIGISRVFVTCNCDNIASYKTIERCGGVLENIEENIRRYWISC